jgi:hypothetical protein
VRFPILIAVAGLASMACSTKGGVQSVRDGGVDLARGTGGGGGNGGTGGVGGGGMSGLGGSGSGGKAGSGGSGSGGSGGSGSGGMGIGGAGGSSGVDASVDKPKPVMGTPCGSQDDCGATSTQLYCRAPGEPYGCGTCRRAVDGCASDADCVPDGGSTTGKKICELATSSQCYCTPVKLCVAGCRTNADCGTGQACNDTHSCETTCVAGDGTCSVDFSCSASGFCLRNTCTSDSQCSVACVKGACYDSRGVCQQPAA